jgi:hypothetical protein
VVDVIGEYKAVGEDGDGDPLVTEFTFDIVPQARGAGDDHEWRMEFDGLCAGSYDLMVKDSSGNEIGGKSHDGTFTGGNDITVFPNTEDVFDDLENAERPGETDG